MRCEREGLRFSTQDGVPRLFPPGREEEAKGLHRSFTSWWSTAGPAYPAQRRRTFSRLAALAGPGGGRACCDAGAGEGALAATLARQGWLAYALDLEPPARPAAGPTWIAGMLEFPPFPEGSLDLVVMCASLQHADGLGLLRRWARVLRPGGQILVALSPVHAHADAARRDGAEARRRIQAASRGEPGFRYQHFTRDGLEKAGQAAGLDVAFLGTTLAMPLRGVRAVKSLLVGGDIARFPLVRMRRPGA